MARKLTAQKLTAGHTTTFQGAGAYDYADVQPLIHLTFTMGSALFTDGFYQSEAQQVRRLADALIKALAVEPRFAWQYGAWMRDAKRGKGNRIQGSLVPALLDGLAGESEWTEQYVAKCLSHRPDDVTAFLTHYKQLGLGSPSAAARRGVARALCSFDEYQLTKYAQSKADMRLCDAIAIVRPELQALGDDAALALDVGLYLHSSTRRRRALLEAGDVNLPMTRARRELFAKPRGFVTDPAFAPMVAEARVTWEQLSARFATSSDGDDVRGQITRQNRALWRTLLDTPGLLPDMAFLRNLRNLSQAGVADEHLIRSARQRPFAKVWPHQVWAALQAEPGLRNVLDVIFERSVERLPPGRHLGIADASGSMSVKVGGQKGSVTAMDVALCLTGLMSETSNLGASFSDGTWLRYSQGGYLNLARRSPTESALSFSQNAKLRQGMGGTQVFGAVMELIQQLRRDPTLTPPDCLWFFSDMQFHPASGGADAIPASLRQEAVNLGLNLNAPPLEIALKLYRHAFGHVDVVLWNLAAYSPTPVPLDMEGVLLVSGFDTNTLTSVARWREGNISRPDANVVDSQQVILDEIRRF